MWNATVFGESGWRKSEIVELLSVPTIEALKQLSRERLPNEVGLLSHLEHELDSVVPVDGLIGRQPISTWAKFAEEESRDFDWSTGTKVVVLDEEALGLYWSKSSIKAPSTIAWHEPTAFILPLSSDEREVRIEFVPDAAADDRSARLRHRYATAAHVLETILDWRGYFGTRSVVIDGYTEMHSNSRGFVARMRARSGYVVGRLLRRLTFGTPALDRDPLALHRERGAARRYAGVAQACPALSEREEVVSPEAMVFVHGTASCGVQGLKDLYAFSQPQYPVRRFEHDTFRKLTYNADELVQLIKSSIRVDNLLLVAHSRGGLVARLALDKLIRDNYPASIALETLGTPHAGTPLANIGGRLLSQLYKIGEWGLNSVAPMISPLAWAHGFLFDTPEPPPGISSMRENSPALEMMNLYGAASHVRCWGASFDISGPGSGFAIEIEGALRGAMYDVENDLVVPTSSALAFGSSAPRLSCSHVQYFSQASVQTALQNYFVHEPSPIVAKLAPTAPHNTQDPAADSEHTAMLRLRERYKPLRLKLKPPP
ncbi:MAG TPA: hypothetical protein VLJ11_06020 [Bryobacteraceae bacterium]|nr:hypothetical protein [Bryobacteraceae bacterium]